MSARVRPAVAADLPLVEDLERACFGADAWRGDVVGGLLGGGRRVVVADLDGTSCGYAVSRVVGDVVDLERIVVAGEHRRRGVASALLADLLDHAARTEGERMLLEVAAANESAVGFYTAHGFEQIDVRSRYYRDGGDALVLSRGLALAGGSRS